MLVPLALNFSLDAQIIEEHKNATSQLWTSLKHTINMHSMGLAVAKEIHTFDRDAADTKERVQVHDGNRKSVVHQ